VSFQAARFFCWLAASALRSQAHWKVGSSGGVGISSASQRRHSLLFVRALSMWKWIHKLMRRNRAWLWPADDNGEFDQRVHRVVRHLGGRPQIYVKGNDEEPPLTDNYPGATMREALAVFSRARKAVLRAHLFMAGSSLLAKQPE
jgi:hypothetical protein